METYKIKMPYYINQNSYYINELNQSMHRALEKVKENDRIILDFTNTEWFNAELTVLLSDYIETFHEKNIHVEVSGLKKAIEITLRKNHFFTYYQVFESLPDKYNTTISFTIHNFNDIEKIDDYIQDSLFTSLSKTINNDFVQYIKENLFEVIHNIRDHSNSNKVFMCGQFYPNKDRLTFAISDIGIGLSKKIKESNKHIKTNEDAILWSFEKGNSTKESLDAGLGLYELHSRLRNKGSLIILTENAFFKLNKNGQYDFVELEDSLIGTVIIINFNINDCLQANSFAIINNENLEW
ncbi:Uncharacterised protein [Staphylococcus aureus]|uniref:hypothetical protein n=1 Tax=Staphylococcus aureus TaxID=1280 RepID=UPI00090F38B4|nr:hypothetical protein [Staphylococcus aureus]MCQ1229290.1 hypothetical protein [Staphylococcus aureus]MCS5416100.1 hypothetical protein [Staphylococcus aureus]SGQ91891.1 Uncharacterised protein [Staphylococcus aureus]SGS44385.1 Uncharacterised protein [Staphylococcus aureus]SGT17099.1 Uncharacterised protein [Staphylococcus aureus]